MMSAKPMAVRNVEPALSPRLVLIRATQAQ
jgi:hypothetical protein